MRVMDEDWIRCFGHDSSEIEPAPKATKQKLKRHQLAAKMINDAARMRDAPHERTLFDTADRASAASVQQERS